MKRYRLGCVTTHLLGRHYVTIYFGGIPVMSYDYGADYGNAIDYVRQLNRNTA